MAKLIRGSQTALRQIARAYGLSVKSYRPYSSQYKHIAAFRVTTNKGTFMIKPFIGSRTQLLRLSSYAARLYRKGFRGMPAWRKTLTGKQWVLNGRRYYYVTEWIHGRRISGSPEELAKLGGMLAKLHTVSQGLGLPPAAASISRSLWKKHAAFTRRLKILRKKSTSAGKWFQQHGDHCMKLSREALQTLGVPNARSRLSKEQKHPPLVHGDVSNPNVLIAKQRIFLIDWDVMKRGSSYYDLIIALTNTAGFSPSRMAAFLKGYETVRPLHRSEKKIISAMYRIPREAWYVCQYASAGRKYSALLTILDKTWNERMEAVHWLDDWSKR